MPKLAMAPIRKSQLIEATFQCIHQYGFTGTTIVRVSQKAGVSTGIINHYFGGKDELLAATMRSLLNKIRRYSLQKFNDNDDPKAHIIRIINSNFAEEQVTPEAITVWLAFWGQAVHVPELTRLQKINLSRLRTNLCYWLKQILPAEEANFAADGLAALIDGLWLRGAFDDQGIHRHRAREICLNYLECHLK